MSRKLNSSIKFLADWDRVRKDSPRNWSQHPVIRVFGSFLSLDSMLLMLSLLSSDLPYFDQTDEKSIESRSLEEIELIFFPVSQSYMDNFNLITMFNRIMDDPLSPDEQFRKLLDIVQIAEGIVAGRERYFQARFALTSPHARNPEEQKEKMNRYVFGPLACKYQKTIASFPMICIGNHTYNGIPLNMSADQFVDRVLRNELLLFNQTNE